MLFAGAVQGTPVAGSSVTATSPGFAADSDVDVTLRSDPVQLGTVQASSTGVATVAFIIPAEFSGQHAVEGVGTDPNGDPLLVRASFTVSLGGTEGTVGRRSQRGHVRRRKPCADGRQHV